MNHAFVIVFILAGIYFIVKGVLLIFKLDPNGHDYEQQRKKSYGYIGGGILFIIMGLIRFYTRIVLWGWT